MIIFIHGADTYRSHAYVTELVDKFKRERDPQGYNITKLEAAKLTAGEILTALSTAPFLADKRMVVINNFLSSSDSEALAAVGERLKNLPEYLIVVVAQNESVGKTKAAKNLFESLRKEKFSREFAPLAGIALEKFIVDYVKTKGGAIEPALANRLGVELGGDLWAITNSLDQLVAYTNGRVIMPADIALFVSAKGDDNAFHLVEAIATGNKAQAFKLLTVQRSAQEDAHKLIGLIAWQLRQLANIAGVLEEHPTDTSNDVAKALKIHPFVVKKNMALARRLSLATIGQTFRKLTALDRAIKTGGGDADILLDRFVLQK